MRLTYTWTSWVCDKGRPWKHGGAPKTHPMRTSSSLQHEFAPWADTSSAGDQDSGEKHCWMDAAGRRVQRVNLINVGLEASYLIFLFTDGSQLAVDIGVHSKLEVRDLLLSVPAGKVSRDVQRLTKSLDRVVDRRPDMC